MSDKDNTDFDEAFDKVASRYYTAPEKEPQNNDNNGNKLEKLWKLMDRMNIVIILLATPLALFLITAYLNEETVKVTMPIFLYWYSIMFTLIATHSINRRIFRLFRRGPVFQGEYPIRFWILVSVNFISAFMCFAVATIYLIDTL